MLVTLFAGLATAAEWPTNWLGNPDNSYRLLTVGVYYHAMVLDDTADTEGNFPLKPPTSSNISADDHDALRAYWLAELAARPELDAIGREQVLAQVKSELEENARFYWRNTRFNCAIDFEYIIDDTPRLHSELGHPEAPWHSPVDWEYYGDARERYDGLLQIKVYYIYDADSGDLKRVSAGGWTHGASDDLTKCGWSWWLAPEPDAGAQSDWLFCHEFGHQLDSLFARSGMRQHWFNHLSMLEGNHARYGEHYDCMSYILRRVRETDWHELKWGELREFTDADGDHVPDSDELLTRLKLKTDPDPTSPDADGDGLSDYWELMANNGNRIGHGQRLHPGLKYTDPLDPDTDSDGLEDGADPLPWLMLPQRIPSWGKPHWSDLEELEPLGMSAVQLVAAADGVPQVSIVLHVKRDDYLQLEAYWDDTEEGPSECQLMLDFDNDGWFSGDDNYRLRFDADGVTVLRQCLAYGWDEWPRETDDTVEPGLVEFSQQDPPADYTHGVRLRLSHEAFPALSAKPGEEFGLNFGIKPAGSPWFYTIGDPNSLVPLEIN